MAVTERDESSAPTPLVHGVVRRRPWWPLEFYRSAIGKKWVMALSGIALMGYVLAHMIGNLKVYLGPDDLNHYGEWLRELGEPALPRTVLLWILRSGLIAAFALHIHAAYALTTMNWKSRAGGYQSRRDYLAANYASRTMRWSGVIVGAFVLWHLADLTWGWVNPDFVRGDPYHNLVESFSNPVVAAFYVLANLALGLHLFHGAWSIFQSLGLNNPRFNHWRRRFAEAFAAVIVLGNVSFPVMVQVGLIDEDNRPPPVEVEAGREPDA
ncbi:MAG: succinate dehydrogenase cytochrome b subunit [Acidimicrobiales bacterium]